VRCLLSPAESGPLPSPQTLPGALTRVQALIPSSTVGSLDIRVPKVGDVTEDVAILKARAIALRKGYAGLDRADVRMARVPIPRSGPPWEYVVTFPDAVPPSD
jgi:hypothetical protein